MTARLYRAAVYKNNVRNRAKCADIEVEMDTSAYKTYSAGISPDYPALAGKMAAIADALAEAKLNVTAIRDGDGILAKHIIDSLHAAKVIEDLGVTEGDRLCDVGSGGGFPALPVAAALPDVTVLAVDATAKKCRYIEETALSAGLTNVTALCARVEEAADLRESFGYVTARAVAALPVLCELCAPLVKVGGYFLAMKGEKVDEEIADAAHCAAEVGLELCDRVTYSLPSGGDHRTIAVYRKVRQTPAKYPREYRVIVKKPL